MTTRDTMYSRDVPCGDRQCISVLEDGVTKLAPELDGSGNVEYKTKLDAVSSSRATHLATQLQWRLAEGDGHAVYVVGVRDNGDVVGITDDEFQQTLATLEDMAQQLGNTCIESVKKRVLETQDRRVVAEVRLAQQTSLPRTELRIAVLGEHSAGKSTILGCLAYDEADDGHGKARLSLLRHRHELESGSTSSITLEMLGFSADGKLQTYANNRSEEHIYQRSSHIATLIDTCGHTKHLKTTARALTGYSPHMFCIVIGADSPSVTATTREYLRIAAAFKMPLVVVVSKMDIAEKSGFAALMHDLLATLDAVLPDRGKCMVSNTADYSALASDTMDLGVVPIFTVSAVRTVGLSELTAVIGQARASASSHPDAPGIPADAGEFEFQIEHLYSIDSVGSVASGWVNRGSVSISGAAERRLVVGPQSSGEFSGVDITSIHTLRIPTETASAGLGVALAVKPHDTMTLQKGMVILDAEQLGKGDRQVTNEFTATVAILDPDFAKMQFVTVHIRSAYHLARVVQVNDCSSAGEACQQATIRLKLDGDVHEYVYPGIPLVARDGRSFTFAGHIAATL
ncbi:GTP binding protein [Coemansia sp. RSA 552]|nr:GTP binding protein [Coemansia sp. RSA 552]